MVHSRFTGEGKERLPSHRLEETSIQLTVDGQLERPLVHSLHSVHSIGQSIPQSISHSIPPTHTTGQDGYSSRGKRPTGSGTYTSSSTTDGPRRRKNVQQKNRFNRSEWMNSENRQGNNDSSSSSKRKSKNTPRMSQGNPSSDSIPFRLNSVSKIDKCSRILFPVTFAIINYFYWHTFMLEDNDDPRT